jgi:nucleoid DNA-binding protein
MIDLPNSITKRILWRYVNDKIHHSIHHYHVFSVLTILFEEILADLKAGQELHIHNFGTLSLTPNKVRKYFNLFHQKVMESKPHKLLSFILEPKISQRLKDLLDWNKTFPEKDISSDQFPLA